MDDLLNVIWGGSSWRFITFYSCFSSFPDIPRLCVDYEEALFRKDCVVRNEIKYIVSVSTSIKAISWLSHCLLTLFGVTNDVNLTATFKGFLTKMTDDSFLGSEDLIWQDGIAGRKMQSQSFIGLRDMSFNIHRSSYMPYEFNEQRVPHDIGVH